MSRSSDRWEYRIETLPQYDLKYCTGMLSRLGSDRWQAYGLLPVGRNHIRIFLKRRRRTNKAAE